MVRLRNFLNVANEEKFTILGGLPWSVKVVSKTREKS